MLVELCRDLAAGGLAALRFDFSGRGDSGGDYWDTDLDVMIADAVAAADWLAKRTGLKELAAVGLCSGSNVALGAATHEDRFASVCALSALPFQKQRGKAQAATRTRSTLRELLLKALRPETYRRLFRGEIAVGRILRRLVLGEGGKSARAGGGKRGRAPRNLKDSRRDIQSELAGYGGRLLFVYGAADAEGLSGWREVLEPFLRENGVEHRQMEIAGADHDYHGLGVKRKAIAAAVEFLAG
jgi:dienelactone hydrolase